MADTTTELERIYTIPLRHARQGTRSKRADRAVRDVRAFLTRHMKTEDVWISGEVNELLWARGKFRIPPRVRVRATRFSDGVVEVTLPDTEQLGSVRDELAERREKAAESPVLAPFDEEAEALPESASLSVTELTGIGPATAEKLEEKLEVETIGDFVEAGPEAVAGALGKSVADVQAWFDQANEMLDVPDEEPSEDADEAESLGATDSEDETTDDSEE